MTDRLDLTPLRQALASLEDSLGIVGDAAWYATQAPAMRNTLMAGVIQNFEFVYELGVKMIKRQIERESATPGEVDALGFRDLLRAAYEKGIVGDPQVWFEHRQMRGTTSHTCDHDKALQVYSGVQTFVVDARALLAALETRNG